MRYSDTDIIIWFTNLPYVKICVGNEHCPEQISPPSTVEDRLKYNHGETWIENDGILLHYLFIDQQALSLCFAVLQCVQLLTGDIQGNGILDTEITIWKGHSRTHGMHVRNTTLFLW